MAGPDDIDDNEILYRRVAPTFFEDRSQSPGYQAFRPSARDTNGLSLYRAKYRPITFAATPPNGLPPLHPVALLRAGDLRSLGMQLEIDEDDHSHVLISNLTFQTKREPDQETWQQHMATILCQVYDASVEPPARIWPK